MKSSDLKRITATCNQCSMHRHFRSRERAVEWGLDHQSTTRHLDWSLR